MAAAYSASKAAVIALTKAIGKDVARTGVSVNCIAPAVIETPMLADMSQEHVDYMVERIPMGRMGKADEVAALDLLARERGVLVLDRRDVRHLRRQGGLLMRTIRFRDATARSHEPRSPTEAAVEDALPPAGQSLAPPRRPARRCGAPASRTSAAATRGSRRAGKDVYALVYDAERPELFLKDAACRRTVGPGEPIAIRADSHVERARARDRRRARRRPRDRGLHDRQRRLLARHRGREPALPPPGEGLRRGVRARPGRARARRTGTRRSRSGSDLRRGRERSLRGRHLDRADEADVRRARQLARARQPGAARERAADRHGPRAARRLHPSCPATSSRSTSRRSAR